MDAVGGIRDKCIYNWIYSSRITFHQYNQSSNLNQINQDLELNNKPLGKRTIIACECNV